MIRDQHQRRSHERFVTDTTALTNTAAPSFWKTSVEPLFNCDTLQAQTILPPYVDGAIDATAKPVAWRDGSWLQEQMTKFGESFGKLYREFNACRAVATSGNVSFDEFCQWQCLDFNTSLVKRFLICGYLMGAGTESVDDVLLSMLSCDGNVGSDAVSEIGISGEKRNGGCNSGDDAPTSLNTAEYEDITRSMYNLLTVLKDRVSQSISEGSEHVNGGDIVKVIEQKEALLFALGRAKQKANDASTADLKSLWMQQSEDIHTMLNVLSTKK